MPSLPSSGPDLYSRTMLHIQTMLDFREGALEDQDAMLGFFIQAIGRELASESTAGILYHDVDGQMITPVPYLRYEVKRDLPLGGFNVLSYPWNRKRLATAICDEMHRGHDRMAQETTAIVYPLLNLAILGDGRHHQAVAQMAQAAFVTSAIEAEVSDLFDAMSTDGEYWYLRTENGIERHPVIDARFSILYSVARIRRVLGGENSQFPRSFGGPSGRETVSTASCQEVSLPGNDFADMALKQLHLLQAENKRLSSEVAMQRSHLKRLLARLRSVGIQDELEKYL